MTKEQKVSIFLKRFLATIHQPKIQASQHHLLCLFPMGCSQGKYHHFCGTAGRGGGRGRDTGRAPPILSRCKVFVVLPQCTMLFAGGDAAIVQHVVCATTEHHVFFGLPQCSMFFVPLQCGFFLLPRCAVFSFYASCSVLFVLPQSNAFVILTHCGMFLCRQRAPCLSETVVQQTSDATIVKRLSCAAKDRRVVFFVFDSLCATKVQCVSCARAVTKMTHATVV